MLNHDLNVNPNLTYDIIDKQIAGARETFLPVKTVRFNKHKHKHTKTWMTAYILRAIQYRDHLYKTYLSKPINSAENVFYKTNLGTSNTILKKDIREAKKNITVTNSTNTKRTLEKHETQ